MKNLRLFGKQQLAEQMKLLTVTTINKKITEQFQELSYEAFYELKQNESIDAIGVVDGYKIILKCQDSEKYYWIHRLTFIDYMVNTIYEINKKAKSNDINKQAWKVVDSLPQLFVK